MSQISEGEPLRVPGENQEIRTLSLPLPTDKGVNAQEGPSKHSSSTCCAPAQD